MRKISKLSFQLLDRGGWYRQVQLAFVILNYMSWQVPFAYAMSVDDVMRELKDEDVEREEVEEVFEDLLKAKMVNSEGPLMEIKPGVYYLNNAEVEKVGLLLGVIKEGETREEK